MHADIGDVDVFSLASDAGSTCVNYLRVIDGAVVHGITVELKHKLEETGPELLQYAIAELRDRFRSDAPEIIVPFDPENRDAGHHVHHTAARRQEEACWT